MPRRTYSRRAGRSRPFHGASSDWLEYVRRLVAHDHEYRRPYRRTQP
jgi:hypothetical protein